MAGTLGYECMAAAASATSKRRRRRTLEVRVALLTGQASLSESPAQLAAAESRWRGCEIQDQRPSAVGKVDAMGAKNDTGRRGSLQTGIIGPVACGVADTAGVSYSAPVACAVALV
jgi:hypothetical protein